MARDGGHSGHVDRRGTPRTAAIGPGRIRLIISRAAAATGAPRRVDSRRPHEILVDILGASAGSPLKTGKTFARIEVAAAVYGMLLI